MPCFYTPDQVAALRREHDQAGAKCVALRRRYVLHAFANERAREHARQGLCRRLETLTRCIDMVNALLPPEQDEVPGSDRVGDATIAIQSFVLNCYGCLDNFAWIWVYERSVRTGTGAELQPR